MQSNSYLKVAGNGKEVKAEGMYGFFIKSKSGELQKLWQQDVQLTTKGSQAERGILQFLGTEQGKVYLEFSNGHRIPANDVLKIAFYTVEADSAYPAQGYSYLYGDPKATAEQYSLNHAAIDGYYLGFDLFGHTEPPLYLEVSEVKKITYKKGMGTTPYMFFGIGLVTDVIVGALILIL